MEGFKIEQSKMLPITKESVFKIINQEKKGIINQQKKGICFASWHKEQPKESENFEYAGTFNVPFGEEIIKTNSIGEKMGCLGGGRINF